MLNNKELSLKDPTDKDFAASSLPEKAGAHLGSAWLWVCLLARGAACAHVCALQCMHECAGGWTCTEQAPAPRQCVGLQDTQTVL